MRSLLSLLILAAVVPNSALVAQDTESRAAEQAQAKREKAALVAEYQPNRVEQQLLAMEKAGGFTAARGLFVALGDIKSGSGPAMGVGYARTLNSGTVWFTKGVYSVRNFKLAQFGLQGPPLAGGRLWLNSRVRWQDAPRLRVHATGQDSPEVHGYYGETMTEVSAEAVFKPVRLVKFGAGAGIESFDTGPRDEDSDRPPLETGFGALPGLYADPDYLHSFAAAAIDARDAVGYSRHGSLLGVTLHDYRQQNTGPYSFQRLDAMAEQYVPILHGNWVLFFAARASATRVTGGNAVPFFLMPALGGGKSLRGYHTYRFRDLNAIQFTGEYRWYAHEYVDVALFYDAGKVTTSRRDLDFSGLTSDAGVGIRFHGPATTVLRIDLAHGHEGYHLVLGFSGALR